MRRSITPSLPSFFSPLGRAQISTVSHAGRSAAPRPADPRERRETVGQNVRRGAASEPAGTWLETTGRLIFSLSFRIKAWWRPVAGLDDDSPAAAGLGRRKRRRLDALDAGVPGGLRKPSYAALRKSSIWRIQLVTHASSPFPPQCPKC
jgi:hypothetical protein